MDKNIVRLKCCMIEKVKEKDLLYLLRAVVAQVVEHFLGKEEVRQFESAQQLQFFNLLFIKGDLQNGKSKI